MVVAHGSRRGDRWQNLGAMPLDSISAYLQDNGDALIDDALTGGDWIRAGVIVVVGLAVAVVLSRLLRRAIAHGIGHGFASIMIARLAGYVSFIVGLVYALTTLGVRVGPLLGALGLGGLVVALALQGVVENFVGSIILQARRPFTIGDSVELDGRIGVVVDIDSRTTLLRALDGTQVRIPSAIVASSTIVNLTREPVRRSELDVGVAYDTDLQHASDVLYQAIGRVGRVLDEPAPVVVSTGFGDSSIGFRILYWHRSDVPSELAARTDLVVAVHQALADAGITIAFPQVVVWGGVDPDPPYDRPPQVLEASSTAPESSSQAGRRRLGPSFRMPIRRRAPDTDE